MLHDCLTALSISPGKPCFLPITQWRYPGYIFCYLNITENPQKKKRKYTWYNDITTIPISTKSVGYSQKSKHSFKHVYFNKDLSRTISLSLLQFVFSRTSPNLQEFKLVSLLCKHYNLRYIIIPWTKGRIQAFAYSLKPTGKWYIFEP